MNKIKLLISVGSVLLILGIILLVIASQHQFEVNNFKKIFGKDVPSDISKVNNIIGGILVTGGLGLISWGVAIKNNN